MAHLTIEKRAHKIAAVPRGSPSILIESYLAGGAPLPNMEGADHDKFA
jgi:hypothetical protein